MAEKVAEHRVIEEESKIPVFTVLKNGSILKNIFLIDNPSLSFPCSYSNSPQEIKNNPSVDDRHEYEKVFLVGRHPDCNIKLEHPSISRFHLRLHSIPSLRMLLVIDLSSVHGTRVCGKRIEPGVPVELHDGDTVQLGESSRIYRLHWVPLSRACDIQNPFVPPIGQPEREEDIVGEGEINQVENTLPLETELSQVRVYDSKECLNLSLLSHQVEQMEAEKDEDEVSSSVQGSHGKEHIDDSEDSTLLSALKQFSPPAPGMVDIKLSFSSEKISEDKAIIPGDSSCLQTDPTVKQSAESAACSADLTKSNIYGEKVEEDNNLYDHGWTDGVLSIPELEEQNNVHSPDFASISEQGAVLAAAVPEGSESQFSCVDDQEKKTPLQHSGVTDPLPISELVMGNSVNDTDPASRDEQWTPSAAHTSALAIPEGPKSQFRCGDDQEKRTNVVDTSASGKPQLERQESPGLVPQSGSGMSSCKRRVNSTYVQIQRSKERSSKIFIDFDVKPQSQKSLSIQPLSECNSASADHVNELVFTPDKENRTPNTLQKKSFKKTTYNLNGDLEEAFTPDSENILRSKKKVALLENVKTPKAYRCSPLKNVYPNSNQMIGIRQGSSNKENVFEAALNGQESTKSSASRNRTSSRREVSLSNRRQNRVPFQSLPLSPISRNSDSLNLSFTRSCDSAKNSNVKESNTYSHKTIPQKTAKEKYRKWTMVVDTASLLNTESRKALQLLQGLPSTSLVIPSIVIRELDCMRRRTSWFRSTKQANAALQWIEDCMVNTHWWIHVQSLKEDVRLIAPTPPGFPFFHLTAQNEKCQVGPFSFSPCSSFLEVVSPATKDHILDCALLFRRFTDNGHVVLLSDDISFKIKAMAEGLRCETAEEFCWSLMNPYSERFPWTGCTPIGPTWSGHDDVLMEKYYKGLPMKQSKSVESVKGLKLILLHESSSRQTSLSS